MDGGKVDVAGGGAAVGVVRGGHGTGHCTGQGCGTGQVGGMTHGTHGGCCGTGVWQRGLCRDWSGHFDGDDRGRIACDYNRRLGCDHRGRRLGCDHDRRRLVGYYDTGRFACHHQISRLHRDKRWWLRCEYD